MGIKWKGKVMVKKVTCIPYLLKECLIRIVGWVFKKIVGLIKGKIRILLSVLMMKHMILIERSRVLLCNCSSLSASTKFIIINRHDLFKHIINQSIF